MPLTVFVLWIGITPATFLRPSSQSVLAMTLASSNAFSRNMHSSTDPTGVDMITHNTMNGSEKDQPKTNPTFQKLIPVKQ